MAASDGENDFSMTVPSQGELLPLPRRERQDVVRIEKNLNSFGFFTPSHKRLDGMTEKSVTIFVRDQGGQRSEARATILPSAKLGLPTTADQDKYYAFQKIVEDIRQREGRIANPIGFTSAQMLKILGRKKSGQSYKEIQEWLERMTLTGIRSEGIVYLAGAKKYARDTFTVFSRTVTVGEVMPDGKSADQNYVWLTDWQIENLNASYVLPIDYDIYRSLRLNISKGLVPLIQIWFYAARRNTSVYIEKKYSELCEILSIRRYPHLSKIKEILSPSLDELKSHRVLQFWEIEKTADGSDYKIILVPGERFLSENRAKLAARDSKESFSDPVLERFLQAMVERGIREERARRILLDLPAGQEVLDQLEYGDYEVARREGTTQKIVNPAGFHIYLIESGFPVPMWFETSRKRELKRLVAVKEEAARGQEAERFLRAEKLKDEYLQYRDREVDHYLRIRFGEEEVERMVKLAKGALAKERPELRLPEPAAREFALRRVRAQVAEELRLKTLEEFGRESQLALEL
jgi:hypothetical protein